MGKTGVGKTPEGRGRRTENDRNGRRPWRERHGKDGRRHGEQKKKDGGKETPAKKTVTVRDGRRGRKEEKAETAAVRAGRQCRGRRCRGRRCRDVPAGASDVSTGRRMHLQRTDAIEPPQASRCLPQKNLHRPTLCIPSFNKRLCAVPASVHFEKQRTHLVGTVPTSPCWPATPIRDKGALADRL